MTIWRGEGGGGDATTDSEINLITSLTTSITADKAITLAAADSATASANAAAASEAGVAASAASAVTAASNAATSESNANASALNASNSASASLTSANASASSAAASLASANSSAASAASASAIVLGVASGLPSIRPTLNLDFANSDVIDPRITFTRASTGTYYDSLGILQTAASGVARLDHDPVTFAAKGLLIEEARTNLLTYSSEFDNAAWTAISATVTANTIIAPDGTLNGDAIVSTGTDSTGVFRSPSVSGAHALTVYAKQGTGRYLCLNSFFGSGPTYGAAWFDLQTGTAVGTPSLGVTQSITPVGNGWYRCGVTFIGPNRFTIIVTNSTSSFASAVGLSIYIWGAQLEAGAFATSYIPTTTAQATRAADSASITGTNFSNWYRQDEGTLFISGAIETASSWGVAVRLQVSTSSSDQNSLSTSFYILGGTVQNFSGGSFSNTAVAQPRAVSYGATSAIACSLGNLSTEITKNLPTPLFDALYIGRRANSTSFVNGTIKSIIYYPKRISNTELQALTA